MLKRSSGPFKKNEESPLKMVGYKDWTEIAENDHSGAATRFQESLAKPAE